MGYPKVKKISKPAEQTKHLKEKKSSTFSCNNLIPSLRTMDTFKSTWCSNNNVRELNLFVVPMAIYPYA